MPDQVRHDGVRLFSCQVNISAKLRGNSEFPTAFRDRMAVPIKSFLLRSPINEIDKIFSELYKNP